MRALQSGVPALILLLAVPPPLRTVVGLAGGVVVSLALSLYFVATFHPRTNFGVPLLTVVSKSDAVFLTFDDGPHPDTTPALLALLAEHDAHATFFFVAESVQRWPELVRQTVAAGHTVGVHGLRHEAMVLKSARQIDRELADAEAIFTEALGAPLPRKLLRPPHGFKTYTLCKTVARLGWTLVGWNNDPRDYDSISAETLARTPLQPGDIVLLHERPSDKRLLAALPALLRTQRNYHAIETP